MSVSNNKWYFALDGDDVGFAVEAEDLQEKITGAFSDIEEYVKNAGGEILFQGGDNLLFVASGNPEEIGNAVRISFNNRSSLTCTVGASLQADGAGKALSVGKRAGKDRTVIYGEAEDRIYNQIQAESESAETEGEESYAREKQTLDYRAEAHYRRLIGSGYDPRAAEEFVRQIYSDSYRDVLKTRKKNPLTGNTPIEAYLIDGEQKWAELQESIKEETEKMASETEITPVLEQKVVSNDSLGFIRFVGNRFVSVEWLNGQKERIALKNFKRAALDGNLKLVPKIRVARKNA